MSNTAVKASSGSRKMTASRSDTLAAQMEPFDSFWEGPEDIEKGYCTFKAFYKANYLKHVTSDKSAKILVISCGPGYFVNVLNQAGYHNVIGIDSYADKVEHGQYHGLNCIQARAFEYLAEQDDESFDVVFGEQELNHLTKDEMIEFLLLARAKLKEGGQLICHGLNGANPIVGAETLAQNWDHQNTFTSYSLNQVLEHTGFEVEKIFGLHLYVFYKNPANYVAWGITGTLHILFRVMFQIYGKFNKIFEKKIAAVAVKRTGSNVDSGSGADNGSGADSRASLDGDPKNHLRTV